MPRCYMVKKQTPTKQYINSGTMKDRLTVWDQGQTSGAPESPAEGCVAPLCYTSLTTRKTTLIDSLLPSTATIRTNDSLSIKPEMSNSDVAMRNFQSRSQEDTEAAHDLLSLSQSLPPLPAPSVVKIHHTLPSEDRQSTFTTTSERTTDNKHRIIVYSRKTKENHQDNQQDTQISDNSAIIELSDDDSEPIPPQKFIKLTEPLQTATLTPLQAHINANFVPKTVNPVATLTPTTSLVMTTPTYSQPIVYVVQMPVTPPTSESSNDGTNESIQIVPQTNFQLVSDLSQENQDILILPLTPEPPDSNGVITTTNQNSTTEATITSLPKFSTPGLKILQNGTTNLLNTAYSTKSLLVGNGTNNLSADRTSVISSANTNPANLIKKLPDRRKKKNKSILPKPSNVPTVLPDDFDSDSKQSYIDVEAMSPSPNNNIVSFGTGAKTKFFKVVEEEVEEEVDSDCSEDEDPKTGKYSCSDCGKSYATSSNLSRHKQTHRNLDSQSAKKCHACGKAYVSMPALAMHLLTHKLGHSCSICGKQFSRPWLLQGHLRSHTGEKPYGCAHCGKAFADRSNLRAHMQTHSNEKQFRCPGCQKTFALKSYLHKHLESTCMWDSKSKNLKTNNAETQTIVLD